MNDTSYDPDTQVDLKKYDEEYRRANNSDFQQTTTFQPVPDGKYQVVVDNVELTKTRSTGNPMIKWRLRIAGPALADRILWKNRVITDKTLTWVKKDFLLCGLNLGSLSELPERLPELVNLRLEVTKRARPDGHEDIYFDKNLTAVAAKGERSAIEELDSELADLNDDLPF